MTQTAQSRGCVPLNYVQRVQSFNISCDLLFPCSEFGDSFSEEGGEQFTTAIQGCCTEPQVAITWQVRHVKWNRLTVENRSWLVHDTCCILDKDDYGKISRFHFNFATYLLSFFQTKNSCKAAGRLCSCLWKGKMSVGKQKTFQESSTSISPYNWKNCQAYR